jgi:hypothetical protein
LNFPGAETTGADVDIAGGMVDEDVHAMNVGELPPFGHVMSVADPVGYVWSLRANLAPTLDLGHSGLLPMFGNTFLRPRMILLKA